LIKAAFESGLAKDAHSGVAAVVSKSLEEVVGESRHLQDYQTLERKRKESSPPKGRPQTHRRGKKETQRTTTFATQASRSTEASANNLLYRKEVVIFWLTLVLDEGTNPNLS
jgi:hypothetical protein